MNIESLKKNEILDGYSFYQETTPLLLLNLINGWKYIERTSEKGQGKRIYTDPIYKTKIHIYNNGSCKLYGSFYKFKNSGHHNYDVFNFFDFNDVLDSIEKRYGVDLLNGKIQSLEFGVNFHLNFDPFNFIKSLIWLDENGKFRNTDLGIDIEYNQYDVKIYSKTKQSRLCKNTGFIPENIFVMRIEVKINKTEKLRTIIDIKHIHELIDVEVWRKLQIFLVDNVLNKALFLDRSIIEKSDLGEDDKSFLLDVYDQSIPSKRFSYNIERDGMKDAAIRQARSRAKKRTVLLVKKTSEVQQKIHASFERAAALMLKELNDKPQLMSQVGDYNKGASCDNCDEKRFCCVTDLPISNLGFPQNTTLTKKGVEYYYYNYPKEFKSILEPMLSERWKESTLDVKFDKIAHIIRSRVYILETIEKDE